MTAGTTASTTVSSTVSTAPAPLPAFPMPRTDPLDPPPALAELRRSGQALTRVRLWDGSTSWLAARHADVRAVLHSPHFSSDTSREGFPKATAAAAALAAGGGGTRWLVRMDPPDHTVIRRMIGKEFTAGRVAAMRPMVERITHELLDGLLARPERSADLLAALGLPLPATVICLILGVPAEDREFFQDKTYTAMSANASPEEVGGAFGELLEYLDALVREKEARPTDDLLGRLVVDQVRPGALSHEDLLGIARLLLIAGHDTTANMVGLTGLSLALHPEQAARLRADPTLVPGAVEELLRYHSVGNHGLSRIATADVEIGGQLVRAGEGVLLSLNSANRDAAVFERPDELDLSRAAPQHLAFGAGIHRCLGVPLAVLELEVVLEALVRRLPGLRLAVPLEELSFRHDMLTYGVRALPVTW
ncbi:cytochrome P450 [Kitasatospora phosalacinea]|uniref:Cytochrome P450 n=1 Tax=Kitasatospora phosalacinea TaxID=2065 RepID=A0A9W6V514_9ACTN|nr:cytochrome P450 [Kitasatospora phosalacinea]GLW72650.1 cytochrome P450 [Kitasatospora phosalacinea]